MTRRPLAPRCICGLPKIPRPGRTVLACVLGHGLNVERYDVPHQRPTPKIVRKRAPGPGRPRNVRPPT